MRRRCGWCGTQLKLWQLNMCRDCKRDFKDDATKPKHREASRWERWLELRPVERDVELFPTTTELAAAEEPEDEPENDKISLRWHEKVEKDKKAAKKGEKE